MKISLIGRKSYKYNDNITINIPKVSQVRGENIEEENMFWREVNLFTQTPSDMISELDSMGIDFEEMTDYNLFVYMFVIYQQTTERSADLLFKSLNLWDLELDIDKETQAITFVDKNKNIIIDEKIYADISELICSITGHEKSEKKKFGNSYAKKMRIKRDYEIKEKTRKKEKNQTSMLDGIILRLVCNANFPYNFETIQEVTIYDLIHSLKQIEKDIQVTDLMQSRLVGNDLTKVPKEELSRFIL